MNSPPPKPEVILTNFFAEPTVLLVPITSRVYKLLNYSCFGRKLFMRSCWMLQTTGFHICKQKTIDNCTWNLSLKFIEVRIFCYLISVIGKNRISWFYSYVEHSEIKTKTVNIIHFPYLDLSQNVEIRDVPYSLKSPKNSDANWHTFMVWIKERFYVMCIIYKWICERKWMNALSILTVVIK